MEVKVEPEQLLASMTYAEKLAQLQIVWRPDSGEAGNLARTGAGALFWPASAPATNALQRIAVEESRHGIPLLIGLDVVHGQFTIFPTPLAQAASFDPEVARADARLSAKEARSNGVNWTFSPMVDVSRDPRWGRVVEGFGEDPYLNAVFGKTKIRGYQGNDLSSDASVAACAKHFVGYSAAEGGRDYNTTDISLQRLRNVYLEPFRVAVAAGVASVMASFNAVSGVPMHGNREMLTDVLKNQWGHNGIVVADAGGVGELVDHGVAADAADAGRLALSAGLDVEMGGSLLSDGEPIIREDLLDSERLDDAVLRVLRLKQALGLFENPYVDESTAARGPDETSLSAARETAARCAVLLKNDDGVLPLKPRGQRVLVVGPYAESKDHLGAWVQYFASPTTTSIVESLTTALPDSVVTTLPGATFFDSDPGLQAEAAAAAAADADLVIVAVGEPSDLSGEASSRSSLNLPGDQEKLIRAIAASGTPFAVVLMTGRPLVVSDWIDQCPALLVAWHLGTEAGKAISDVLTGAVNPGGKLPMSFPRSVGQVPIYYNHESTGRPARTGGSLADKRPDVGLTGPNNTDDYYKSKYLDLELGPQFGFGYGLSYTSFELESSPDQALSVTLDELSAGSSISFTTIVRNTGTKDGDEVVQLYVSDLLASVTRPVRQLRDFTRVFVPAGEERRVSLTIGLDDLGFWTNDHNAGYIVEPGDFRVGIGNGLTSREFGLSVTPSSA
ncbi:glycoside hydrolase family 3 N-terminal domain-containing protein [Paenarthrobacter nitroguajacolicus]|uniref:glycoside hydrolase family 3 N-terminal domain-containing protein n=1 Tax=Paenarthrobacter nitroguajacolicus TaxID=211146 RepID=UPI000A749E5E|nr:glycoside hydrolase family 3 N-terminal domain-containing protein [Paenarthrobacter nitroguajacolicus]